MKRIAVLPLFLAILILICGCTDKKLTKAEKEALKFKEEYENLNGKKVEGTNKKYRTITIDKNNPMRYKKAEDIAKMIEDKESFIVYFGFNSCPWCRSVLPTLLDVSKDLGIDTIYYVDVKDIRDVLEADDEGNIITKKKGTEGYYKLLEQLDKVLEKYTVEKDSKEIDTLEKRIYAPSVVSVVNGEAKELETGISKKQTDGYIKLTKAMKKETYNKFKCSMKCVIDSKNTCSSKASC